MTTDFRRTAIVGGTGTYGYNSVPTHLRAAHELGNLGSYCAYCFIELNRTSTGHHGVRLALPNITDASPPMNDNRFAEGFTNHPSWAAKMRAHWERQAFASVDSIVRVLQQTDLLGAANFWYVGCNSGHHLITDGILRRLHEKKPDLFTVLKTTIPADTYQRPDAVAGIELFSAFRDEGVVLVTVVTDNDSPFSRTFKLGHQDAVDAAGLVAYFAARPGFIKNKSLAEVAKSLGKISPFAGMAASSRNIQSFVRRFDSLNAVWPGRRRQYEQRHLFWIDHVAMEGQHAVTEAMTKLDARLIAEDIHQSLPCFCVLTIPVERTDQRAWEALSNTLRTWARSAFPNLSLLFCAGQGTKDPRYDGDSWIQATVLFPLPPVPSVIKVELRKRPASSSAWRSDTTPLDASPAPLRAVNGQRPQARKRRPLGRPVGVARKERPA